MLSLKRSIDDNVCHTTKRMRIINHAYDHMQPTRVAKRRNQEELAEPAKKSKVIPCVKGAKRRGDSIIMNPTKRIKTIHRSWRRIIVGCRPTYDSVYHNDKDSGNNSVLIASVA